MKKWVRHYLRKSPDMFLPGATQPIRIVRESGLIKDNSMPSIDWKRYDAPAKGRFVSKRNKVKYDKPTAQL